MESIHSLETNPKRGKSKLIVITTTLATLLVVSIISITIIQSQDKAHNLDTLKPENHVVKSIRSSAIESSKDEMLTALKYTIYTVKRNYFTIKKTVLRGRESLKPREIMALNDCLQMIDLTLSELQECELQFKDYGFENYTLADHKDTILTLLSAAQTNQDTCVEGFSHDDVDDKVREGLIKSQMHVFKLVSNVLAIFKKISDTDQMENGIQLRGMEIGHGDGDDEWPEWLSEGDRRILQAENVTPDVTVAADGSGDYLTVSDAVAAAPEKSSRYVIKIKAGVYREYVEVPKKKINLMFIGDGRQNTIITASRSVGGGSTTFNSFTVAVVGGGFLARDITFQNAAGPSNDQAVALRVNADLVAFYRCGIIAYQDTLYVHSLRQFFTNCYIAGTVDFIFGNAAVVFQNCDIRARRPGAKQRNMVTAQGRTDPNQNTGIVIQKCQIGATSDLEEVLSSFESYLGRPWKNFSRTVVMQTEISNVIEPAGWYPWSGDFALDTLFYAEYANTGAGADTSKRVTWPGFRVFTSASQAEPFTAGKFIDGGSWLSGTGFPFTLGL